MIEILGPIISFASLIVILYWIFMLIKVSEIAKDVRALKKRFGQPVLHIMPDRSLMLTTKEKIGYFDPHVRKNPVSDEYELIEKNKLIHTTRSYPEMEKYITEHYRKA